MKKIVINKDFAFIYLNPNFYNKESILTTINQYKDFINSSISQLGKYYVVKIERKTNDYSLETLANEISNYILSIEFELNQSNK